MAASARPSCDGTGPARTELGSNEAQPARLSEESGRPPAGALRAARTAGRFAERDRVAAVAGPAPTAARVSVVQGA